MKPVKLWNKILKFFGLSEVQTENKFEDEEEIQAEKLQGQDSKIVSISKNKKLKLLIHQPESYNEVQTIVDDLKSRKPVILNLERIEHDQARRLIDFIGGAVYGIDGSIYKVSKGVFIFTPGNIEIDGTGIGEDLENNFISQ